MTVVVAAIADGGRSGVIAADRAVVVGGHVQVDDVLPKIECLGPRQLIAASGSYKQGQEIIGGFKGVGMELESLNIHA